MKAVEVVEAAIFWVDSDSGRYLFTGNGQTSRIASQGASGRIYCCFGGMSLAPTIARGFLLARNEAQALAVEGDGNFWMRSAGQLIPETGLLHVVVANGSFASTGGQPLGVRNNDGRLVAKATGYRGGVFLVKTRRQLDVALKGFVGPSRFVWAVVEDATPLPPRGVVAPAARTRAFMDSSEPGP